MSKAKQLTYEQVIEQGLGKDVGAMIGQFFFGMPMLIILKHAVSCPECKDKFKFIESHSGHPLKAFLKEKKKP